VIDTSSTGQVGLPEFARYITEQGLAIQLTAADGGADGGGGSGYGSPGYGSPAGTRRSSVSGADAHSARSPARRTG